MVWPYLVFGFLDFAWFGLGCACLALAGALVLKKEAFVWAGGTRRRFLPAAALLLPCSLALYNLARYKIYYLTADSGNSANLAWNFAHGYGLRDAALGDWPYFSIHFAFTVALLAPFLWICNSAGVVAAAQGLAVGSAPVALFLLAKRLDKDSSLRWVVLLLAMAHPRFQELACTVVDNSVFAFPFFVWAAYFFETDRPELGFLFSFLTFSTREQVPFISLGVGLFLFFRDARRRRIGALVAISSALLWLAEMKIMRREQVGVPMFNAWGLFQNIGGSPASILHLAAARPWSLLLAFVSPPAKLLPVLSVLMHAAFMPLLSGVYFFPALAAWAPHQLADYGTHYQALQAHYSSFVLGPLLWAMVHGLVQRRRRLAGDNRRKLDAVCLAVAAWGFLGGGRFYDPAVRVIPSAWRVSAPKALALIPPRAKVWCDAYLLPNLAMRRYVKTLPTDLPDAFFESNLFAPDYILISRYWPKTVPAATNEAISRYIRDRRYEIVFQEADLVLLKNPKSGADDAPPEPVFVR